MRQGRASGDVPHKVSPFVWPPLLSPPPLRLDHFWKLARKSRRISRIGPAPARFHVRFRGLLTARASKLLLFLSCHVMCLPPAMCVQLLALLWQCLPPAPRLFGNRNSLCTPPTTTPHPTTRSQHAAASRPAWFCFSEHRSTAIKRKPCKVPSRGQVYTGTLFTGVNFI